MTRLDYLHNCVLDFTRKVYPDAIEIELYLYDSDKSFKIWITFEDKDLEIYSGEYEETEEGLVLKFYNVKREWNISIYE